MFANQMPDYLYSDPARMFAQLWERGETTTTASVGEALHDYVVAANNAPLKAEAGLALAQSFVQAMQPQNDAGVTHLDRGYNNIAAHTQRDFVSAADKLIETFGDWNSILAEVTRVRYQMDSAQKMAFKEDVEVSAAKADSTPGLKLVINNDGVER